jgi:hypothetical protein
MAKKKVVEIAGPVGAPEETLEITVVRAGVPTYTISADTGFGMLAMLAIHRMALEWGGPGDLRREVACVMREFEMWEEAHRGDAHA